MTDIFLDFFNSFVSPNKIINSTKNSFFIPLLILGFYVFSPIFLTKMQLLDIGHFDIFRIKFVLFVLFFSYLSAGIRIIFSSNNNLYFSYISSTSPMIIGLLGKLFFNFSILWIIILRSYIDIGEKNYHSLIVGTAFDLFLIWWLL